MGSVAEHPSPAFFLYTRFLNRNADDLPIYPSEELRFGKALQPVVNLLVRQGGKALAVRWGTANEKRARDNIVNFSLLIPQGTVQRQV